jgi:hypothetical protein
MVLKLGHCGKYIRNTWRVLKCGAGEGWRSVGPIVQKMKYYTVKEERNILHTKKEGKLTGLVTSCIKTAF